MAPVADDEWVDVGEWEDVGTKPKTVAEIARERLTARGIKPNAEGKYAPVDSATERNKVHFIDTLHEVANKGPNPFQYALAAARGAVGLIPMLPVSDNPLPAASGAIEGMNMGRRVATAQTEFKDDPWRRRLMTAAGAVPVLGEPLQAALKPSMIASNRVPTDEERLASMEGAFSLGTLAAAKAKGVAPEGGELSAIDPTRGVRQSLSTKTAPKIGRNLLKPKNSQMQFGADPGEFVVGMKTKAGEGVQSYGPQIEAKLNALNAQADQIAFNTPEGRTVPIDYEGALRQGFAKHIAEAVRDNNQAMALRLQGVLDQEIAALHRVTGGAGEAPARVGRRYQQDLGNQVGRFQKSGKAGVADPADGTINMARQDAWVAIKNQTNEAVPGLRDVNEQLHSGIEAGRALHERVLTESKEDPLWWLRHPVAATVAAVPKAATSPFVRSRVAAGLRSLSPLEAPPSPEILPNEATPWRSGVRRPANEQRGLPPAPMDAPEGFIASDDLRRVGTRMGQIPGNDAAVFASKNVTPSDAQAPPVAPIKVTQQDWLNQMLARRQSPILDLALSGDPRKLGQGLANERSQGYLSGSPAGRVNPTIPDWMMRMEDVPQPANLNARRMMSPATSPEPSPAEVAQLTERAGRAQQRAANPPVQEPPRDPVDIELASRRSAGPQATLDEATAWQEAQGNSAIRTSDGRIYLGDDHRAIRERLGMQAAPDAGADIPTAKIDPDNSGWVVRGQFVNARDVDAAGGSLAKAYQNVASAPTAATAPKPPIDYGDVMARNFTRNRIGDLQEQGLVESTMVDDSGVSHVGTDHRTLFDELRRQGKIGSGNIGEMYMSGRTGWLIDGVDVDISDVQAANGDIMAAAAAKKQRWLSGEVNTREHVPISEDAYSWAKDRGEVPVAVKSVADKFFNGDVAAAEKYLRDKGEL